MRVDIGKMIEDAKRKKKEEQELFKRAEIAIQEREQAEEKLHREEEELRKKQKKRMDRLGGKDDQLFRSKYDADNTFPTLIHCREHIYNNSHLGIEDSSLNKRMGLSSHDLENIVDGQIEVRLRKTKTENEEWISFNENWRFVYPFNLLSQGGGASCKDKFECKGNCSDITGNRVYVLQFKNDNSIYSGGTNKCVYWRYHQHSICERSKNCDKLKYPHDPKKGLRWDLMHKFYSDKYVFRCKYNVIENWLNANLKSCGYNDHGDGGKDLTRGLRK